MGPKTAAKVVEKVVPKDEAQVFYVKIKLTAPAPVITPPPVTSVPTASSIVSQTTTEAPAKPAPKSPTKKDKDAAPATVATEPTPPPVEEMQEAAFEIIVNLLCRSDIVIDYIRRQFVKLIQDKLAAEDPEKKIGEELRTKLKNLQTELASKSSSDLVLRDAAGVDVVFKEVSCSLESSWSHSVMPLKRCLSFASSHLSEWVASTTC